MVTPLSELSKRKKTDRHFSFAIYMIVIFILIGLFLIITIFMGMHWERFFLNSYQARYYFAYRFPFFPNYFLFLTSWVLTSLIASFTLSVVLWWYQWQLYKRRNQHIERVKSLKKSLIFWLKEKYNLELHPWVGSEIQLSLREQKRGTGFFVLWVVFSYIFSLVGFVLTLVVWYWLTMDYYVHEKGELQFFYQVSEALKKKGINFNPKVSQPLVPRNMVLYIVLMVIPGVNLIWAIWWSYVLFRDPNAHFDTHKFWESQLEKIIMEKKSPPDNSPLEILKKRYAQGQITRDEFQQTKEDLEK